MAGACDAPSPLEFRKSSYSANESACVEVAETGAGAAVRDTQHRDAGHLSFSRGEWDAFIRTLPQR